MNLALYRTSTSFIGLAMNNTTLHTPTSHPECKTVGVVARLVFAVTRSQTWLTKFTSPDYQSFFQHPALIQLLKQCRNQSLRSYAMCSQAASLIPMLLSPAIIHIHHSPTDFRNAHA